MKYFITLILIIFCSYGFSQKLNAIVKTTKDSVAIKWLPADFEAFTKIVQGAKIYRVESKKVNDPKTLNYNNGKVFNVKPAVEVYKTLNESNPEQDKFKFLLSPFIEGTTDPEEENFAFGTATIENVINAKFQFVVGNIIVDKEYKKGSSFYYKIEVKGLSPIFVFVDTKELTKYAKIDDFNLLLDKKKTVEIKWDYKSISKEAFGFTIDHSIDNTKQPEDLLPEPYLPFKSNFEPEDKKGTFRHDNPKEGHFHYYRVSGLDPFGLPSLHSEWKKVYVPKNVHAAAEITKVEAKNELRLITGKVYLDKGKESNVEKVSLLRSLNKDSNYTVMKTIDFNDTIVEFTLSGKVTDDHYYYKLLAYNEDDTASSLPYYFFTLDQTPPAPPTDITGVVDSFGVVNLTWKAPADKDVKGYRVYRGNALDEDFVEQTTRLSPKNEFNDTLRLDNLSSKVYYFIRTVDNNYNNSVFSDTVLLIKPDTIAPVSAVLYGVVLEDSVYKINWVNSNSEDLKKNVLFRINSLNKQDTLLVWKDTTTHFIDNTIVPGNGYTYQINTIDLSNNKSVSKTIYNFYEPGYRKPLSKFRAVANMSSKGIELSWSKAPEEVYSYVIYRAKEDGKFLPLKTITDNSTSYLDKHVRINNAYSYSVKYVTKSGIHSIPVKEKVIYQ